MTTTLVRLFDRYDDAAEAVDAIERLGVPSSDISIVANRSEGSTLGETRTFRDHDGVAVDRGDAVADDAGKGAGIGAVLGGGAGLLAGLGVLAIPGVGPVVGAGWLVATLVGAATGAVAGGAAGGLIGALTEAGVPEHEARTYAEGVKGGGTLLTVRAADAEVTRVQEVLDRYSGARSQMYGTNIGSMGGEIPPSTMV